MFPQMLRIVLIEDAWDALKTDKEPVLPRIFYVLPLLCFFVSRVSFVIIIIKYFFLFVLVVNRCFFQGFLSKRERS